MSDVEAGSGGEDVERKKKKKKKHRSSEEKEERRLRKEAETASAAGGDEPGSPKGGGDDGVANDEVGKSPSFALKGSSKGGVDGSGKNTASDTLGEDEPRSLSKNSLKGRSSKGGGGILERAKSVMYKVGLMKRPVDYNDGYTGEIWVKPSKEIAEKHARAMNVMQIRAGIKVFLDDDVLENLDGDEIFAEIYSQCERKGIQISKVIKTGTYTATIEDVILSQAKDLVQIGVKINDRRLTCVKEELSEIPQDEENFSRSKSGRNKDDRDVEANAIHPDLIRQYDLKTTGPNELGELGVGIGLYFHSLLWGARVLGLLSIVGLFTLVTYASAGYSTEQTDSESLTGFAIPTLGAVIWTNENGLGLMLGSSMNTTVMAIITSVECFMALMFMYLVKKMKRDQSAAIDAMDVSNISLQDYAVKVDYLPREVIAEEIGTFFSKFGKVHQVTLGTDVGSVIGKHRKRSEMISTREELAASVAKSRGKNMIAGEQLVNHDKEMEKLETQLLEATKKTGGENNRVTSAFVTFETEDSRKLCEKKMKAGSTWGWLTRRKKYKFQQKYRLWVNRAPEASDILWENLAVDGWASVARYVLSWVFMTVLLVCTMAMVVLAESAQSTVPPAIACDAPAESGALDCDAIWPAAEYTGSNSSEILLEVLEMMSQVDAVTCVEYVSGGKWRNSTTNEYDGHDRIGSDNWYDADGEWSGGFDATSIKDECSAMACFDCFCKTRVTDLIQIGLGFADDDDGYYALCETYFVGQAYGLMTSGFTAVLNIALGTFTRVFSNFEKHHTKSGLESSVSVKLFLALVVNSALIPLLVFAKVSKFDFVPYLFAGPYEDFEVDWYQAVGGTLSTTLIVNAVVFPLTALSKGLTKAITRKLSRNSCLTQKQLNAMYEGNVFDLSERYAQMLAMIFVALCFQAAMPLLVPVTALFCFCVYHEAKVTLLRYSKKPPAYDETMAKFFWAFAPSAAFFKLFFTVWMISYGSVPSYGATVEPVTEVVDLISEDDGQFAFSDRLWGLNGFVAFFTTVIVVGGTVLNQNRVLLGSVLSKFGYSKVFASDDDDVSNVPDISIALSDGILKGLPNYMIQNNPEYNEFVPSTATIGAGGLNQPPPPEWEAMMQAVSAAEEERMRVEMKKMTATFVEEAAVDYSGDMGSVLKKKKKTKRGGKVAPEDDDGFSKPQLLSKDSNVEQLNWGEDGGEDEGGGGDDNDNDDDGKTSETAEEKAERRRKRKEKKERKKAKERGE